MKQHISGPHLQGIIAHCALDPVAVRSRPRVPSILSTIPT